MWILDRQRDTRYRVSDRVFSVYSEEDEALGIYTVERKHERPRPFSAQNAYNLAAVTMPETAFLKEYLGTFQRGALFSL